MDFKKKIAKALSSATGLKLDFGSLIEQPPSLEMGDFAFPCFIMARELKKSPMQISADLAAKIPSSSWLERLEAKGPYLNFFLNKSAMFSDILSRIMEQKDSFGSAMSGKGKTALVEHTSINPNASPHVGRARNAIIGDTIVRLLRFEGYAVDVHYFVNDVGKQIAMLVLGSEGKKKVTFDALLQLYIDINKKVEENPAMEKEVFALLNRLENGDEKVRKKFRAIVETCVRGQSKIFGKLGIKYDSFDYESEYLWNKRTTEVIAELQKTGKVSEDEEGRLVLNQEEYHLPTKAPFLVLTRADKTSLYPLRDIAYTIDKALSKADRNIIVLGEDQKLYFQQLASALDLLGYKAPNPIHYSFVLLAEGKMSTRQGNVALLEDFMKEAVEKARKEIEQRHGKATSKVVEAIAYGAVKYAILKVSNEKNVIFEWESALSFDGESGPYLQYAHARAMSIIRKAKNLPSSADFSLLTAEQERKLVPLLGSFPDAIASALEHYRPNVIAMKLMEIAQAFNEFYHACPCLGKDVAPSVRDARLLLVSCSAQVLRNGLGLLGISALEKM